MSKSEPKVNFVAVVPEGNWVYHESMNLQGRPAVHLVSSDNPNRTLCGRDCIHWRIDRDSSIPVTERANCKVCLQALKKREVEYGKSESV